MSALPRLFVRERAGLIARLALTGLCFAGAAAAAALAARAVAGLAAGGRGEAPAAVATLAAAACVLPLLHAAEQGLAERLALAHVAAIRDRLLRHSFALPPRLLAGRRRSLVALRFVGDMNAVRGWIRFGLARLIVLAVALPGFVLGVALVDPAIAAVISLPGLIVPAVLLALAPTLRRRHAETRRRRARLAAEAAEALGEAATVRAGGRAASVRDRVRRHGGALAAAAAARARLSYGVRSLPEAITLLTLAGIGLVAALGAAAVPAEPAGLVGAVVGLGVLAPMLADLARALDRRCDAQVAYAAITRFLALPPLAAAKTGTLPAGNGAVGVSLELVRLRPEAQALTATIVPGETVGVTGPAGAGKSLLLACLAGLDTPAEGAVRVGGVDPLALDWRERRDAIALAAPELALLSGSLRRMLRWRAPAATDAQIAAVAEALGLSPLVARAGGLGARVGRHWTPSRVERGLIVLARALVGRPRLLLLDAPEMMLDRAGLDRLAALLPLPGTTVLVATEDPALLARCGRVLTLAAAAADVR